MKVIGLLHGGAPVIKKYQINATFANAGVPGLIVGGTNQGVVLGTTTSATDLIGYSLDTGTYTTTRGQGASSAEVLVSFIINPLAIGRWRLSGGATDGTALTARTVTTANSDGLTITHSAYDASSPDMLGGYVWGLTGANVGQFRKTVTTTSTTSTVTVPFDYLTVVGDTFLYSPVSHMSTIAAQLTTNVLEIDASAAVSGDAAYAVIDAELNGTLDSFVHMIARDHFLNPLS